MGFKMLGQGTSNSTWNVACCAVARSQCQGCSHKSLSLTSAKPLPVRGVKSHTPWNTVEFEQSTLLLAKFSRIT